ncbi:MAG TPA: hypothetical protein VFV67_33915 [Actinophytocola sp.]|uniref:hypothetical protein n=1 Tax=Actinophytocola sp. TaxID=1872138 RepID=UPI002DBF0E1C|nr:hypothetical protein [Actinophytocola sp.]HEU5475664.1 hypothetical protein [Actinophytocola sp.]
MTTSYAEIAADSEALAFLLDPALDIHGAHVPAGPCGWCDDTDAVATVRVYGQPRADVFRPVELVECCARCANTVTDRAVAERATDTPIVVEVSRG